MLKHNEVNPLNVFGLRRLEHCPPHFEKLLFDLRATEKDITDWVYENLASRFYFADHITPGSTGSLTMCKCIAFEDAGELSYFGMFLDTINRSDYEISI
jgi:hypothetical protein